MSSYKARSASPGQVILDLVLDGLSVLIALSGFWVVSSIAIHKNAPLWEALAVGLLVFPGLPLLWTLWRKSGRGSLVGRVVRAGLRVNTGLAIVGLVLFPHVVFTALATRGDWPLEQLPGETAAGAREALHAAFDSLEFLDREENLFAKHDQSEQIKPTKIGWDEAPDEPPPPPPPVAPPPATPPPATPPPVAPPRTARVAPPPPPAPPRAPPPSARPRPAPPPPVAPPPRAPPVAPPVAPSGRGRVTVDPETGVPLIQIDGSGGRTQPPPPRSPPPTAPPRPAPRPRPTHNSSSEHYVRWMLNPRVHPIVEGMPKSRERDYATVARYIADMERDPFERVKAIHDYIATRVRYKADFDPSRPPPANPTTVFSTREAVCAGYALLFKAMMESIGGRAVYISGYARFTAPSNTGPSHAWNGVEIEGRWYLLDITWDAGQLQNGRFEAKYKTDFLLPPPEHFVRTHYPRNEDWQLLAKPLPRGEFLRMPLLLPRFHAYGLTLVAPNRAQISAQGRANIVIENPRRNSLIAEFGPPGASQRTRCGTQGGQQRTTLRCDIPRNGEYLLYLFAAYRGFHTHEAVASFEVNNRI